MQNLKILKPEIFQQAHASSWFNITSRLRPKKSPPIDPYTPGINDELYKNADMVEGKKHEYEEAQHYNPKEHASKFHKFAHDLQSYPIPKNVWPYFGPQNRNTRNYPHNK